MWWLILQGNLFSMRLINPFSHSDDSASKTFWKQWATSPFATLLSTLFNNCTFRATCTSYLTRCFQRCLLLFCSMLKVSKPQNYELIIEVFHVFALYHIHVFKENYLLYSFCTWESVRDSKCHMLCIVYRMRVWLYQWNIVENGVQPQSIKPNSYCPFTQIKNILRKNFIVSIDYWEFSPFLTQFSKCVFCRNFKSWLHEVNY